jgi:hypothetical protein
MLSLVVQLVGKEIPWHKQGCLQVAAAMGGIRRAQLGVSSGLLQSIGAVGGAAGV